ncbi:inositol polyphosphate 5-phosphatase [Podochytrium sp. JEL0797]|nr:inositol polyphosphate 5-phosphatase [Podochytrium sp. JEL0797]
MLSSGLFYYSLDMDLTSSRQSMSEKHASRGDMAENNSFASFELIDPGFLFNQLSAALLSGINSLETYPFILPTIFGYVASCEFLVDNVTHQFSLISRCSNKRAGTRYCRGLDVQGSSAIEVETEMILQHDEKVMAYRQLRGSTPLIWKSSPPDEILQPVTINSSESAGAASRNALTLHLSNLVERYNAPTVTLVSLLSRQHRNESLAMQYQRLADTFRQVFWDVQELMESDGGDDLVDLVEFDERDLTSHPTSKMPELMEMLRSFRVRQRFFSTVAGRVVEMNPAASMSNQSQRGVFRINGIDCVDMTNVVQYMIGMEVLYDMLKSCGIKAKLPRDQLNKVKNLWIGNGRALALLYTGSNRVLYEEQIQRNWSVFEFGKWVWWIITRIGRLYMGTFRDNERQEAFECLLGQTKLTHSDAIAMQNNVQRLTLAQTPALTFFMIAKRFLSPTHVNTSLNWVCGAVWLVVQAIVRTVVGNESWKNSQLQRIGSKLDTSTLPVGAINSPVDGLSAALSRSKTHEETPLLEVAGTSTTKVFSGSGRRMSVA